MAQAKKCEHPACNCMVTDGSSYCSPYCKDAKGTTEIACGCGHAGCGTGAGQKTRTGGTSYNY